MIQCLMPPDVDASPHQTMPTMPLTKPRGNCTTKCHQVPQSGQCRTPLGNFPPHMLPHMLTTSRLHLLSSIFPLLHPQSLLYSICRYLGNPESLARGFWRCCSRANLENALGGRELLPSAGCRCHCTCCVHNPQILLLLALNALILIMHNWRRHRVHALFHPLPQPTSACQHVSSWVSAHLAP